MCDLNSKTLPVHPLKQEREGEQASGVINATLFTKRVSGRNHSSFW